MNDKLLVTLSGDGDAEPLFLVPASGLTPFSFIKLAEIFSGSRPVYSFQFPGLMDRREPHGSIYEMADDYVRDISELIPEGPLVIGGHCWGGLVALEVVHRLEIDGREVRKLLLMESLPPPRIQGDSQGAVTLEESFAETPHVFAKALRVTFEQMFQQLGSLPENIVEKFGRFGVQQLQMSSAYEARPIQAPIAMLRTQIHNAEVFSPWRQLSSGGYSEQEVSGETFSILAPPYVAGLCRDLEKSLAED